MGKSAEVKPLNRGKRGWLTTGETELGEEQI
jgi:hypothetical protein